MPLRIALKFRSAAAPAALTSLLALSVAACGGAGDPPPGWGDNLHGDILVASTRPGGGALAADFDFDEVLEVPFSQCFGGSAPACSGGIRLYSAEEPGFAVLRRSEPSESLYALPGGIEVEVEVTAADPEASLFLEGKTLAQSGDRAELGETPDLHAHGSWQLAIPAGEEPQDSYAIVIRLHASDGFAPSQEYVVLLTPVDD